MDGSGSTDKRAVCGVPSQVWRAGQERRYQMIRRWAPIEGARVLDAGADFETVTAERTEELARIAAEQAASHQHAAHLHLHRPPWSIHQQRDGTADLSGTTPTRNRESRASRSLFSYSVSSLSGNQFQAYQNRDCFKAAFDPAISLRNCKVSACISTEQ